LSACLFFFLEFAVAILVCMDVKLICWWW